MSEAEKKREYTTYPIGPLSYTRTVQAIEEALLLPLERTTRSGLQRLPGFAWDRLSWLSQSETDKLKYMNDHYEGRAGPDSGWWDDEVALNDKDRTLPPSVLGVNTRETSPWNNAIHLVNTKDGIHNTHLYFKPKVDPNNKWVFRFDMVCPLLASLTAGAHDVFVGLEVPFQGGRTIFCLEITQVGVNIWLSIMDPTGAIINQTSADISAWVATGVWKNYHMIVNPTNRQFSLRDELGNVVTIAITPLIEFYPMISPFYANESPVVTPGVYVGQYAAWHIVDWAENTLEAPLTAIVEGQVTLTGAAQQFPADACKSITIENPSTNAVVCIGHDNTVTLLNGYRLQPGATYSMDIDNANRVWVIGTAPQIISYGGVN